MKWHDIEQNSEEWSLLRAGKLTGSSFGKIMAKENGALGSQARDLAKKTAVERITGRPTQRGFYGYHMQRGHEQEPIAIQKYEEQTFNTVSKGGFFDCGKVGVSPDCLIDEDGVGEIKSVEAHVHYDNIVRQSFDPTYRWQYIGNLYFSERQYLDFISYCADYPADKQIYICTIEIDQVKEEIERLAKRIEEFFRLVDRFQAVILNSNYEVKYATA